jgi:hypothetical protein
VYYYKIIKKNNIVGILKSVKKDPEFSYDLYSLQQITEKQYLKLNREIYESKD